MKTEIFQPEGMKYYCIFSALYYALKFVEMLSRAVTSLNQVIHRRVIFEQQHVNSDLTRAGAPAHKKT